MLTAIIFISLLNTTILLCLKKWGWLEMYAIFRKPWMPEGDCYLCLSFWLGMLEILGAISFTGAIYLIVPFCSCALTSILVNTALIHDYNKNR